MESASDATLEAYEGPRATPNEPEGIRDVLRAFRSTQRALDALFPLARGLQPIGRFILGPAVRGNAETEARLASANAEGSGVLHSGRAPGTRGGFSLESTFPVNMESCSYNVLWDALKRVAPGASATERAALFHDTAARVYRITTNV